MNQFDPKIVLGKDGVIATKLIEFESRQSQIVLADYIQRAFLENKHLLANAETGTGKSFAAILAAIKTSFETKTPVVISTHTIALQEQLFNKDVPFLRENLELDNLEVILAKGRGNYISLRRAKLAERKVDKLSEDIKNQYVRLKRWIEDNPATPKTTPSLSGVPFKPNSILWEAVRSDTDDCLGEACPTYKSCHFYTARSKLEKANIIITNHSLVLLDRKLKSKNLEGILPDYSYIVIDEAHELEEVARKVFSFEFREGQLDKILSEIYGDDGSGILYGMHESYTNDIITLLESGKPLSEEEARLKQLVTSTVKSLKDLKSEVQDYFENIKKFLGQESLKRIEKPNQISNNIFSKMTLFSANLVSISTYVKEKSTIEFVLKRCSEIGMGLDAITNLPKIPGKSYSELVAWASSDGRRGNKTYCINSMPIFLKPIMKRMLFSSLKSVVLMSATLATAGNDPFMLIKSNLGLDDSLEPLQLKLPPIFDYKSQVTCYLVKDLPEQSNPEYIKAISEQIIKFVSLSKGGALVLFTSFDIMQKTFKETKDSFEMQDFKVFIQGGELNKNQMIEEFKKIKNGVLLGVNSFWTGVDIPGDSLRNLIIVKLPFVSPEDPLVKAQQQIYEEYKRNYFIERSLPMAGIMLKQGFGRLIRRKSDKGVVVFLDSRLVTKPYGKYLLNCLPRCEVKYVSSKAK